MRSFSQIHSSMREWNTRRHRTQEIVLDDQLLVEQHSAPFPLRITTEELPSQSIRFPCPMRQFFLLREELDFQ